MAQFTLSAEFECSPVALREYLGATANFALITDPELEFELVEAPELVAVGAEIAFSVLAGGIRQVLRHRWITVTDLQITAEQVMGPAQSWLHDQTLSPTPRGCELTETITFEPPGGMLGFMVTEDAILQSLSRGTAVRHELIARQLIAEQLT